MKAMHRFLAGMFLVLVSISPAMAVDTTKVYNSGILVLVFLGFLAMILLVQLLPALAMLWGMIRGMVKRTVEEQKEPVEATTDRN